MRPGVGSLQWPSVTRFVCDGRAYHGDNDILAGHAARALGKQLQGEGEAIVRCHVCGGEMVHAQVTYCFCDEQHPFIVRDVPALVCQSCGERAYSTQTLADLERVRDGQAVPSRLMNVPVYSLSSLA